MNNSPRAEPSTKLKLVKLHFFYVGLILSAAVLLLATQNWTKLEGFTEYLSVAATITSLVLGVLAIIYSFVTSNSTNNFLGSVESSTRDVKQIGAELRTIISRGQDLQNRAEKRNEDLHEIIRDLRTTIDGLATNTSQIAGAVDSFPQKIDLLRKDLLAKSAREPTSTENQADSQRSLLSDTQIESFLDQTSITGIAAIRALCEAAKVGKNADLNHLFKNEYYNEFDYAHGFLVATAALNLLEFELNSSDRIATKIVIQAERLPQLLEAEWDTRLDQGDELAKESLAEYGELLSGVTTDLVERKSRS